jgi:Trk-type K+ transport system membrane component
MAALIIAGGLGFPVLLDLLHLRRRPVIAADCASTPGSLITATLVLLAAAPRWCSWRSVDGALATCRPASRC